jgi:hypothetical protein
MARLAAESTTAASGVKDRCSKNRPSTGQLRQCEDRTRTDSGTLQMKVISQRCEQVRWYYNGAVVAVKTEIPD